MGSPKRTGFIDEFRLIAAIMVIAIHTSPLASFSKVADFILTRIICRVAVPFFFMVTGYFLSPHIHGEEREYIKDFCIRIGLIYGVSIIAYLPLNAYAGYFSKPMLLERLMKDVLFNGTFYHLWYLPALILGVSIMYELIKWMGIKKAFIVSTILYTIGILGDSLYGVYINIPFFNSFYGIVFRVFEYTRNGLFFAPIFLVMGIIIYDSERRPSKDTLILGTCISTAILVMEGTIWHNLGLQRHDSMYIMLIPLMFYLFQLILETDGESSKDIRNISLLIYIIHPWVIVILRGFAKAMSIEGLLVHNSLIHFTVVSTLSILGAWLLYYFWESIKSSDIIDKARAWVEIDLDALAHNIRKLEKILPGDCKLMAVVKANAYGHGDIIISKELNRLGVDAFAVATLAEGVCLRKNGIKGGILVLGYTDPKDALLLARYKLTQTVFDYDYARDLNREGKKVKVHIKIDTGMHRLGIDFNDIPEIEGVYSLENLVVEGVFSHLSVCDSLAEDDIIYTKRQIDRFFDTINKLKDMGYSPGKIHIQSSYGILNYPNIPCDYARPGIALYGALSGKNRTLVEADLWPVLSLKARVAEVREIHPQEAVGYGRQFISEGHMRIAIVTAGYADGIPRGLSGRRANVLVHGEKAPIIGRICMDQLIIDVTHIGGVKIGDEVTIIGGDGIERICCEDLAEKSGTISNEILAGLGNRLEHIVL